MSVNLSRVLHFVLLFASAMPMAGQDVAFTLKATAALENHPVQVVVPFSRGAVQDPGQLMLVDAGGSAVPAQINMLNRYWATDGSLRHAIVHFLATLPIAGEAGYRVKVGAQTGFSHPVQVSESGNALIVSNGIIRATLNRNQFKLFEKVERDLNGDGVFQPSETILAAGVDDGAILTEDAGELQRGSSQSPIFEVEERGPGRVVVRFESYTKTTSNNAKTHGFQARLYFFANSDRVRVQYTLKNSDHTVSTPRPMYFDDVSLISTLAFAPQSVRFGSDDGAIQRQPGDGLYQFQSRDNAWTVRTSAGGDIASGSAAPGWICITGEQAGVTVAVRDFWQTWPGCLELDNQQRLRIGLWPRFGEDWYWRSTASGAKTTTQTGLYWLDDMQEVTKEIWYQFHDNTQTSADCAALTDAINRPGAGHVNLATHRSTRASLDMGGYLPNVDGFSARGDFDTWFEGSPNWNSSSYLYGWFNYAADVDRRSPCETGDWAQSGFRFAITGNPAFYHLDDARVRGELNSRPIWLSGYQHDRDDASADLLFGYCWASWRRDDNLQYRNGTSFHEWLPRDLAHLWYYNIEEFYYLRGEPRVRDWYRFMGEALKVALIDDKVGYQTRSTGHALSVLLQAYRVTGEATFLETAKQAVRLLRDQQNPYNGTLRVYDGSGDFEATLEVGYLSRALVSFLEEIGDSDPQAEVDAWGLLQGFMEWNLNLSKFTYKWDGRSEGASGASVPMADPQAWYYLQTGDKRFRDQLINYIDNAAYGHPRTWLWRDGDYIDAETPFIGRLTQYMLEAKRQDSTPAEAIANLQAEAKQDGVELHWQAPIDAQRYHIRWSEKPIVEGMQSDRQKTNFWAARGVGQALQATPGSNQSILIKALPSNKTLYFGMVSFDAANNMSALSNVVSAETGQIVPVRYGSFRGIQQQGRVMLRWQVYGKVPEAGFTILRGRKDKEALSEIAVVHANPDGRQDYSFQDIPPAPGEYVYQLVPGAAAGAQQEIQEIVVQVGLPQDFVLEQNFPNPFNPQTRIRFSLPETSRISLTLHSLDGKSQRQIVKTVLPAGWHTYQLDARGMASGTYWFRLAYQTEGSQHTGVQSKKLLLLK